MKGHEWRNRSGNNEHIPRSYVNKQALCRQGRKGEYQGLNCEGHEKQGRKGMKRKEEI